MRARQTGAEGLSTELGLVAHVDYAMILFWRSDGDSDLAWGDDCVRKSGKTNELDQRNDRI